VPKAVAGQKNSRTQNGFSGPRGSVWPRTVSEEPRPLPTITLILRVADGRLVRRKAGVADLERL